MTHTLFQEKCAMPANGPHAHKIWWVSQAGRADYREPPPLLSNTKRLQRAPERSSRPNARPATQFLSCHYDSRHHQPCRSAASWSGLVTERPREAQPAQCKPQDPAAATAAAACRPLLLAGRGKNSSSPSSVSSVG